MEDDLFEKLSFICQRKENSALKKQTNKHNDDYLYSEKFSMGWSEFPNFLFLWTPLGR